MVGTIDRVTLTHLQIPFKEVFRISGGAIALKEAILVTVSADSGLVGMGESSPMSSEFGYSADTPEGCWTDLASQIVPGLLGKTLADTDDIGRHCSEFAACSRFALAGAETALWDLLGQARGQSLAELLGAREDRIELGVDSGLALGIYDTVVDLLYAIDRHMDEGYSRIKLKIRPGQDLDVVHAARRHIGDVPLMVDANAAYTGDDLGVFRKLDECGLLMFEQPMAADDIDGLVALQAVVSTPVCIDETADDLARTLDVIRRGGCRIVNLKIQRVGGFGPALAMHDACAAEGVACWVGTMPELGIGQAQGIHLAALDNCKYPTDVEPSARWFVDDYVEPLLELAAPGIFEVPTRPGLGYQINPAKVKRYQIRQQEFRL
jgi:O-succinylbenzoate synthase